MEPARNSACFDDVSDLGRAAGFDLGFRQLDSGPQVIPATLLFGEHVTLVRMRFNRAYHQLGSPPDGTRAFGIPLRGMRTWNGREYEASSILPFDLPDGIDGVSTSGFRAITLSVDDDSLRSVGESFQIPVPESVARPSTDTVFANGQATLALRSLAEALFSDVNARMDLGTEEELIAALLCAALTDSQILDRSRPARRSRAINAALTYLDCHERERLTVGELCSETGIALRTLNRAFLERFGVGPKTYMTRRRLAGVRAELRAAKPGSQVVDIANSWGFWHMGQFARDYAGAFAELPSVTLKRNRPCA